MLQHSPALVPTTTQVEVSDELPNAESTPLYYTNSPTETEIHSQVSSGVEEPVIEVQEAEDVLPDFVSLNIHTEVKYPVRNYISYSHLSPTYQCYLAATSSVKEPATYSEAVQDQRWVEAMKAEVQALESNQT
ncbi:hypothetical protein KY285_024944 [Solanum tuberosum]|nr:hypothetical protein KY284_025795 [Solanum tuberosum]KAH0677143.1 hypothetical protein KY285_024944 [Solanum tuberosum]